jgi:hypothetical protein
MFLYNIRVDGNYRSAIYIFIYLLYSLTQYGVPHRELNPRTSITLPQGQQANRRSSWDINLATGEGLEPP